MNANPMTQMANAIYKYRVHKIIVDKGNKYLFFCIRYKNYLQQI